MFAGIPLFPEQASTLAPRVDNLYFFIVAVTAFFGILTSVVVIWFAMKYRTDDPLKIGARITGSIPLELAWSIIPFIISIVIFVWATDVFFDIYRPPDQTLEIYATGKRWMWKFQHLDGKGEINELHVPVGKAVKVTFTSEDVLHSLYFPDFRTKADAIPGRYSAIWFTATKVGSYHIFCAEYCGTNHSGMVGRVHVMEPAAYQAWLSGAGGEGNLTARGERLFTDLACVTCHLDDGKGRGPSLVNKFGSQETLQSGQVVTVDDSYVRESILTPQQKIVAGYQPLMPTFQGMVNEESVMALIEYVKSKKTAGQGSGQAAAAPAAAPAQENR
jgi:cytochrome c oxidase subunit 2